MLYMVVGYYERIVSRNFYFVKKRILDISIHKIERYLLDIWRLRNNNFVTAAVYTSYYRDTF